MAAVTLDVDSRVFVATTDDYARIMSSEVFESINLVSKVDEESKPGRKTVSLETYSEDELDPVEFLLSESPSNLRESYKTANEEGSANIDLLKVTYNNLQLFLNPSKILGGNDQDMVQSKEEISFPEPISYVNNEDPIKFLTNKNNVLIEELNKNIHLHKQALDNGDGSLFKYRSMIDQNFAAFSELSVSLQELYSNELNYNQALYNNFNNWDHRRMKVLARISNIRSDSSPHGAKLTTLINDKKAVDEEIASLQAKIVSLQHKKQVLNVEIQNTSSILESRSSKYVEMFKNLEKQGLQAIKDYINLDSTRDIPSSIISMKQVDVTFARNFDNSTLLKNSIGNQLLMTSAAERHDSQNQTNNSSIGTKPYEPNASIIGMKPYVLPEEPPVPKVDPNTTRELNYGHGPTAFEQGYIKGEYLGQNFKIRINKIVNSIAKSLPDSKNQPIARLSPHIEDISNSITEKLDYEPIKIILEQKIKALKSLILQTSRDATIYHKCTIIWQDAVRILNQQESKLQTQISESVLQMNDSTQHFAEILRNTIDQLKSSFELHKIKQTNPNNGQKLLMLVISNEIVSVCKALNMVSKNVQIQDVYDEFEQFGFTKDNLH